jgi:hypothetical protein
MLQGGCTAYRTAKVTSTMCCIHQELHYYSGSTVGTVAPAWSASGGIHMQSFPINQPLRGRRRCQPWCAATALPAVTGAHRNPLTVGKRSHLPSYSILQLLCRISCGGGGAAMRQGRRNDLTQLWNQRIMLQLYVIIIILCSPRIPSAPLHIRFKCVKWSPSFIRK